MERQFQPGQPVLHKRYGNLKVIEQFPADKKSDFKGGVLLKLLTPGSIKQFNKDRAIVSYIIEKDPLVLKRIFEDNLNLLVKKG